MKILAIEKFQLFCRFLLLSVNNKLPALFAANYGVVSQQEDHKVSMNTVVYSKKLALEMAFVLQSSEKYFTSNYL